MFNVKEVLREIIEVLIDVQTLTREDFLDEIFRIVDIDEKVFEQTFFGQDIFEIIEELEDEKIELEKLTEDLSEEIKDLKEELNEQN